MQEEFEKWWLSKGRSRAALGKDHDGQYSSMAAQEAYRAFVGGWASREILAPPALESKLLEPEPRKDR